jgi:putative N6-adenine-specific DNA methylase
MINYRKIFIALKIYEDYIITKTFQGLESVLAKEITELGGVNVEEIKRGVKCNFSKDLLYRINLEARTCLRALVPVYEFEANSPEELYDFAVRLDWENYLHTEQTFAIDFAISSEYFKHSQFASLKLKDAICDRFRNINNSRPSVKTFEPDILFNLHIYNEKVTISLDSSGESLHKRGYRSKQHEAPINEVLAAGLVLLSEWDKNSHFVDGMCGSGTILCEAVMIAIDRAPNADRNYFAVKNWRDFDTRLFREIKETAKSKQKDTDFKMVGADITSKSLRIAEENIRKAGLFRYVQLEQKNFLKMIPPYGGGVCIINPPYGERLQNEEIDLLYKHIGDSLKQNFSGYRCGIISSNMEALKHIGLKTTKKFPVMNGKLECKFQLYDLYEGSKKIHASEGSAL